MPVKYKIISIIEDVYTLIYLTVTLKLTIQRVKAYNTTI